MLNFLLKVWGLGRPYRSRLILGVVAGIINGLLAPVLILTLMFVYSAIFQSGNDSTIAQLQVRKLPIFMQDWVLNVRQSLSSDLQTHRWALITIIAMIPLLVLVRGIFAYLNVYCLQWAASRTVADLRTRLFTHLLNLSAGFYTENSSGRLISRVMSDTGVVQVVLNNVVSVIVRDPVALIGVMGGLLWTQPKLTLISMVVLPVCIIPIVVYSRKIRRATREMQSRAGEQSQIMSEAFTGHRVIKAYNLEKIVADQFHDTTRRAVGNYMRIIRASEMPGMFIEFFGSIGVAILLAYLIHSAGSQANAVADAHSVHPTGARPDPLVFIQLIGSIFFMYAPIKNLTRLQNQLVQARAAGERAFALLATENSVPEPIQPRAVHAAGADIEFDRVSFAYGEKVVLHDINLKIKSGQLVALVGASGSGKTTLSNLLLRFYDPKQGVVRIGGVDMREFNTRDLRNQIAVVAQENILFNETIRRNIELGRPGATNEEIIAAAKHAHAHEFILENPDGYDTVIGEKGVKLSGGQRQRLAIARAVLRNAPILILDEATNALDTESERAVQTALDELMKGRTTLCIAHRLSTVMHANLIVVMEQGRIVETGRHDELATAGGVYQKLYELQFRE